MANHFNTHTHLHPDLRTICLEICVHNDLAMEEVRRLLGRTALLTIS